MDLDRTRTHSSSRPHSHAYGLHFCWTLLCAANCLEGYPTVQIPTSWSVTPPNGCPAVQPPLPHHVHLCAVNANTTPHHTLRRIAAYIRLRLSWRWWHGCRWQGGVRHAAPFSKWRGVLPLTQCPQHRTVPTPSHSARILMYQPHRLAVAPPTPPYPPIRFLA